MLLSYHFITNLWGFVLALCGWWWTLNDSTVLNYAALLNHLDINALKWCSLNSFISPAMQKVDGLCWKCNLQKCYGLSYVHLWNCSQVNVTEYLQWQVNIAQVMIRQQAISRGSVDLDLCHHMTSLGSNVLIPFPVQHFHQNNNKFQWLAVFDYHDIWQVPQQC